MPERVVIKNDRQLRLIADVYAGERPGGRVGNRIVILVPGLTHHRSDPWNDFYSPRLTAAGFDVCAFDPSGCGESDDDQITIRKHIADLHSVLSYFWARGYEEIGVIGFSFGGLLAIWSWNTWVKAMALIAPVTHVNPDPLSRFAAEELQEYDSPGNIVIKKPAGSVRERVILDRSWIEERKTLDYQTALRRVQCPVKIIHGNEDTLVPIQDSIEALKLLPAGSRLEVVNQFGHTPDAALQVELADSSCNWLIDKMKCNIA